LERWLGSLSITEFRRSYLGREPFARPFAACALAALYDWSMLDRLLVAAAPDTLVVSRGKLLQRTVPGGIAQLRALFDEGIGLAVRQPEELSPSIAELTTEFARDLPGEQRIIVFATPKGSHGFGWHYDTEDVFIVQTAGDKEYFFRRNTVDPPGRRAAPNFASFVHETTPMMSCRLVAGDVLYLPRGFWHVAHAHEHSLSVSLGVFPA
jgi:50S ribosomal protein L16 3-hydroxylase